MYLNFKITILNIKLIIFFFKHQIIIKMALTSNSIG